MSNSLTVVILAKNEEKMIARCLSSVVAYANEVLVIDDLSTDDTVRICRQFPKVNVISHDSNGLIERQKRVGIKQARGEWILLLEADMYVPENVMKLILAVLKDPHVHHSAFKIRRKNLFYNKPLIFGGAYDYDVRIFKKDSVQFEERIHSLPEIRGSVGVIPGEFIHDMGSSSKELFHICNNYTDIEAEEFFLNHDSVSLKEIEYRLTWKSLKLFWKLYIRKRGYKDGNHGFIWCVYNMIGPQIKWLKICEKALKKNRLTGVQKGNNHKRNRSRAA